MILFNKYKTVDPYNELYNKYIDFIIENNILSKLSCMFSYVLRYHDDSVIIDKIMVNYRCEYTTTVNNHNVENGRIKISFYNSNKLLTLYTLMIDNNIYFIPIKNLTYIKYCINNKLIYVTKDNIKHNIDISHLANIYTNSQIDYSNGCSLTLNYLYDNYKCVYNKELNIILDLIQIDKFYNELKPQINNIVYINNKLYQFHMSKNINKTMDIYLKYLKTNINLYRDNGWNMSIISSDESSYDLKDTDGYIFNIYPNNIRYIFLHNNNVDLIINNFMKIFHYGVNRLSIRKIYIKIFEFIRDDNIINISCSKKIHNFKKKILKKYKLYSDIKYILNIWHNFKYVYKDLSNILYNYKKSQYTFDAIKFYNTIHDLYNLDTLQNKSKFERSLIRQTYNYTNKLLQKLNKMKNSPKYNNEITIELITLLYDEITKYLKALDDSSKKEKYISIPPMYKVNNNKQKIYNKLNISKSNIKFYKLVYKIFS